MFDPLDTDYSEVRARLEELLATRPTPTGVAVASSIDPATLGQDESLLLAQVLDKHIAFLTGRQLAAVAQVAGPEPDGCSDAEDWVREEVAISLGLSTAAAERRITLARRLAHVLPATSKALLRGEIGFLHALNMSEKTAVLSDEDAGVVEMAVLLKSPDRTLRVLQQHQTQRHEGRPRLCTGTSRAHC